MTNYSINVRILYTIVLVLLGFTNVLAQSDWYQKENYWSEGKAKLELQKYLANNRVLYVAAHPDDENTRLISYLENSLYMDVAYLSMTKGSGGQNLIGEEIGEELGLIREQELYAARRVDGAEQYFTSALDFGYSKSHVETFEKWNKDKVLAEVVYRIRKFQPRIIITRFSPETEGLRSTHGHHTASAILALEAYKLAADSNAYPEQLDEVTIWQAEAIYWNTSYWSFGSQEKLDSVIEAEPHKYVRLLVESFVSSLGKSISELASESRSHHKSQGFGTMARYGYNSEALQLLDGTKDMAVFYRPFPKNHPADMNSVEFVRDALKHFGYVYGGFKPYTNNLVTSGVISKDQQNELLKLYFKANGLRLLAEYSSDIMVLGTRDIEIGMMLSGSQMFWNVDSISFEGKLLDKSIDLPEATFWTGTYSIDIKKAYENPTVDIWLEGLHFSVPVVYRTSDPVKGEILERVLTVPPLLIHLESRDMVVVNQESATIKAEIEVLDDLQHPVLIQTQESSGDSKFLGEYTQLKAGKIIPLEFQTKASDVKIIITYSEGEVKHTIKTIKYDHLPWIRSVNKASVSIHYVKAECKAKTVGYIMGAGDKVASASRELGVDVIVLDPFAVKAEELTQYDAIVFGIRALNTIENIEKVLPLFHEYAKQGGTLIFQYNTAHRLKTQNFMPEGYEISLSRDRVTEEDAKVKYTQGERALSEPNRLSPESWDNWVQERGLYFPNSWSDEFRAPLFMADRDSESLNGSLLIADYGEGTIVYTGLSFFRELPAGVEGAYQLWANLLSL